jgi:hypothetical protein
MQKMKLDIHFDDESRETATVYVDGSISGKPTKFIFDTGCASTAVPFNDITSSFQAMSSRGSSGALGDTTLESIVIDSFSAGIIEKRNVEISRGKAGGLDRSLLGMDILKDFCFHVKFSEAVVELLADSRDFNQLIPLIVDNGNIPYVDVVSGDVIGKAVWDTGAGVTLVDQSFMEKNPTMFKAIGSTSGTDSTGTTFETPLFEMQPVQIGGQLFKPHKVVVFDLSHINSHVQIPMDFILGYSTLVQAHWIFDFPRKKWGITKMVTF